YGFGVQARDASDLARQRIVRLVLPGKFRRLELFDWLDEHRVVLCEGSEFGPRSQRHAAPIIGHARIPDIQGLQAVLQRRARIQDARWHLGYHVAENNDLWRSGRVQRLSQLFHKREKTRLYSIVWEFAVTGINRRVAIVVDILIVGDVARPLRHG